MPRLHSRRRMQTLAAPLPASVEDAPPQTASPGPPTGLGCPYRRCFCPARALTREEDI
jgi:hypothetical protein